VSSNASYGVMAQEVMTINKYLKAILGLRYSYGASIDATSSGPTKGDAWNPMAGIMISPLKNITTDRQNLNFVGFYFYLFVYQLLAVFIFVLLKTYPLSK
jgi:hypothetical protein